MEDQILKLKKENWKTNENAQPNKQDLFNLLRHDYSPNQRLRKGQELSWNNRVSDFEWDKLK